MPRDVTRTPTASRSPDHRPSSLRGRLVGALCALLGGASWVTWVVLGERQPPCCPGGVSNPFLPLEWWKLTALLLLAVAAGTLVVGRSALPRGRAWWGAALVCGGAALGGVSLALEAAGARLDRPFAEIAAIVLLLPLGTVLLGAGALAERLLPRAVALALLVGGASFYLGNSEARTMLFWAVLGIAWSSWGAVALHDVVTGARRSSTPVGLGRDR